MSSWKSPCRCLRRGVGLVKAGNARLDVAERRLEVLREGGKLESLQVDTAGTEER